MNVRVTDTPNMNVHITDTPSMNIHVTDTPNLNVHVTDTPNMNIYVTATPNMNQTKFNLGYMNKYDRALCNILINQLIQMTLSAQNL